MRKLTVGIAVVVVALCFTLSGGGGIAVAQWQTIYFDDFSGLGADPLLNTVPDISPGGETWTASTRWNANGTISAPGNDPGLDHNAFLPFSPEAGKLYRISTTVGRSGFGDPNGLVGFFDNAVDTNSGTGSFPEAIMKSPNSWRKTGPFEGDEAAGDPSALEVLLDTRPAVPTIEWITDGTPSIYGVKTLPDALSITRVGFGVGGDGTSRVSDMDVSSAGFRLEVEVAVPEPASLSLLAMGGLGLAFVPRRRRRSR